MKKLASYLFVAILGGLVAVLSFNYIQDRNSNGREVSIDDIPMLQANYPVPHAPVIGPDFVNAADLTVHAVVHIQSELQQRNQVYNDFFDLFDDFFGNRGRQYNNAPVIATGSGVIISQDGYIVTNNHVVQNANRLTITLNDKRTYEASVIGRDPSTDLALVKIDETDLPYLVYGDSDNLKVGEWVLAVGNPFNLTSTVTAGIVSAKARNINILGEVSAIESFIQTDAVVNRGNSGGALVNTDGELIGINAAIASNTGSYTGYSFAIPSNIVKKVINDFIDYGEIQRAYLGVTFREIDSEFAKEKGLEKIMGVYVVDVAEDGAASEAGIESGDVIVQIDNSKINSKSSLLESVGTKRPGNSVKVYVQRGNKMQQFDVVLKNRSGNTDIVKKDNLDLLGATFKLVPADEKESLNIDHGIQIVDLAEGKLRNAGIRKGFIIMFIDKEKVTKLDDIRYYLETKRGGTLIEGIYPNGQRAYYGVGL
ncbi:MAG: Do family serine endopeptidase [Bacteroidales bacterium]|nr:Do family serine endopeptidase [Bacteroidales bacterium]MCF8405568.1 Do family serine endopeptidase [Bacteroidales bacterium]